MSRTGGDLRGKRRVNSRECAEFAVLAGSFDAGLIETTWQPSTAPFKIGVIVGATALIVLLGLLIGEKIPINNGLGWDGLIYGTIAKEWPFDLVDFPLDQYALRRILPSFVVHYSLRIAGVSLNDTHVIYGFGLLNVCCLTCVAWLWVRIAQVIEIGRRGRWLGFCGFILNFAVLKHTSYYPVLTDIPAYAIGCAMLLSYLQRSAVGLCLLTAAGAFVWAPLLPQGLILLLFPRGQADENGSSKSETGQQSIQKII